MKGKRRKRTRVKLTKLAPMEVMTGLESDLDRLTVANVLDRAEKQFVPRGTYVTVADDEETLIIKQFDSKNSIQYKMIEWLRGELLEQ